MLSFRRIILPILGTLLFSGCQCGLSPTTVMSSATINAVVSEVRYNERRCVIVTEIDSITQSFTFSAADEEGMRCPMHKATDTILVERTIVADTAEGSIYADRVYYSYMNKVSDPYPIKPVRISRDSMKGLIP